MCDIVLCYDFFCRPLCGIQAEKITWESRTLPDSMKKRTHPLRGGFFFHSICNVSTLWSSPMNVQHCTWSRNRARPAGYRQVLCANSFTSLAELSLHRAGKPALNYLIAEDRERVKGGEAACEALDVNSVFCYQPASSSCISMYFMLMYFFPPHWVPAT